MGGGADIPLDQILAGAYRSVVKFGDRDDDVRGLGEMLRGETGPSTGHRVTPRRGTSTGPRQGWTGLAPGAHVAYQKTAAKVKPPRT